MFQMGSEGLGLIRDEEAPQVWGGCVRVCVCVCVKG